VSAPLLSPMPALPPHESPVHLVALSFPLLEPLVLHVTTLVYYSNSFWSSSTSIGSLRSPLRTSGPSSPPLSDPLPPLDTLKLVIYSAISLWHVLELWPCWLQMLRPSVEAPFPYSIILIFSFFLASIFPLFIHTPFEVWW